MLKQIRPAIMILVTLTIITGLAYPLAITGLARVLFPYQANGSLIEKDGKVIGSALIDATKTVPAPYNAQNSVGSNLAPTAKALVDRVKDDAEKLHAENPAPV